MNIKILHFFFLLCCGVLFCGCKGRDGNVVFPKEDVFMLTKVPTETPVSTVADAGTPTPKSNPTEALTKEPTEAPTKEPTEAPTKEPTEAPTKEPTEVPTKEPTEVPTKEPTEVPTKEPTEVPTKEPAKAPTKTPTEAPTKTPTEAPTKIPTEDVSLGTEMPERKVVRVDLNIDKIPIEKSYFSDVVFRGFIKEKYDTDGDGFLSKQEREQVTMMPLDVSDVTKYGGTDTASYVVIDGLDWFPNLQTLFQTGSGSQNMEIYLDHHSGIRKILAAEEWGETFLYIDGCENLRTISYTGESCCKVGLYIHDCKNLEEIDFFGNYLDNGVQHSKVYISQCPNLKLAIDADFPETIWLDANAKIRGCPPADYFLLRGYGTNFSLSAEGLPCWEKPFNANRVKGLLNVNWIGLEPEKLHLEEQISRMYAMNRENLPEGTAEEKNLVDIATPILFSPKKTSVYVVSSAMPTEEKGVYDPLKVRYYIVEENGKITGYDSLESLSEAADKIEDLPKNLFEFLTHED